MEQAQRQRAHASLLVSPPLDAFQTDDKRAQALDLIAQTAALNVAGAAPPVPDAGDVQQVLTALPALTPEQVSRQGKRRHVVAGWTVARWKVALQRKIVLHFSVLASLLFGRFLFFVSHHLPLRSLSLSLSPPFPPPPLLPRRPLLSKLP